MIASAAALAFCLTMPLPVSSPSLPVLAAALALLGACKGLLDVSMNAQAAAVERRVGRVLMSSFHALFSLGGVAGALLAAGAMWTGMSDVAHVAAASLVALAAVTVALTRLGPACPGPAEARAARARLSRSLVGLGILALLGLLAEGAMADWSAVYLRDTLGARPALAAGGFAAFSLATAAGRFTGDAVVGRFGGSRVLRASGAVAAAGLAGALLVGHPAAGIVGCALVGLGIANIIPVLFSAAARVPVWSPGGDCRPSRRPVTWDFSRDRRSSAVWPRRPDWRSAWGWRAGRAPWWQWAPACCRSRRRA